MLRAACLALLIGLIGCGAQPRDQILDGSPAADLLMATRTDSAYLAGSFARYPEPLRTRQYQRMQRVLRALVAQVDSEPGRVHTPLTRWARTWIAQLAEQMHPAGMESLGLGLQPDVVLHDIDLLPVLRVSVVDPARVRGFFERVARAANMPIQWAPRGKWSVWNAHDGEMGIAVAVRANALAIGVYAVEEFDRYLPQLLGEIPALKTFNAAEANHFLARRAWTAWNFGWIDFGPMLWPDRRLTRWARTLGEACPGELRMLSDLRIEFGFRSATPDGYAAAVRVPLKTETRQAVERVLRPARGPKALQRADGLYLSMGLDLSALLDAAQRMAERRKAAPLECPMLVGLNHLAHGFGDWMVPAEMHTLEGLALALPGGMVEQGIPEAAVALYARDSAPLVELMATQLPFLAQLTVGTVHPLPVPFPAPVHWLSGPKAIGASIGTAGAKRLRSLVEHPVETDAFLIMHLDEGFVDAVQREQERHMGADERRSEAERQLDAAMATTDLYFIFGRVGTRSLDIDITARYQDAKP